MEQTPATSPKVKVTTHGLSEKQTEKFKQLGQALVNLRLEIAAKRDEIRKAEQAIVELEGHQKMAQAHGEAMLDTLKTAYSLEGDWAPTEDFKQLALQE